MGARHKSDVFSWKIPISDQENHRPKILTTLMTAARLFFARFLQIDPRSLGAECISKVSGEANVALIHFFEHGSSGSSYMDELNNNWDNLKGAIVDMISGRNIKSLLSYDTAYLMRTHKLDINVTADWLEQHPESFGGTPYQVDGCEAQKIQWNEMESYLRHNKEINKIRIFLPHLVLQEGFAKNNTLLNTVLSNGKISNIEIYVPNPEDTQENYSVRCDLAYLAQEDPALPRRHIRVFTIDDFTSLGHICLDIDEKVFFAKVKNENDDINRVFASATWSISRNEVNVSEKMVQDNCNIFLPPLPQQDTYYISLVGKNPQVMYLDGEEGLNSLRNKQIEKIIYLDQYMFSDYYFTNLTQLLKHFTAAGADFYLMASRNVMNREDANNMQKSDVENALRTMKDTLNLKSCKAKIGELFYYGRHQKFPHDRLLLFQFEDKSLVQISLPHGVAFTDPQRTQFEQFATMTISTKVNRILWQVIVKYYQDLSNDRNVVQI